MSATTSGSAQSRPPVSARHVITRFVGTADEIAHYRRCTIGDDDDFAGMRLAVARNRPTVAGLNAEIPFDFLRRCGSRVREFLQFAELYFVHHVIGAQHAKHKARVAHVHHRFQLLIHRQVQKLANVFARFLPRRVHEFERLRCSSARGGGCVAWACYRKGFGEFKVRRVIRFRAIRDHIFAALSEHLKLMRREAADVAGVGGNRAKFQSKSLENFHVRVVHDLIALGQRFLIDVERIRIFHDEFARTHHAKTRATLITKLRLDVIEVSRQLTP